MITPDFVGRTIAVLNGRQFTSLRNKKLVVESRQIFITRSFRGHAGAKIKDAKK
jgi:ribosomal protein S19